MASSGNQVLQMQGHIHPAILCFKALQTREPSTRFRKIIATFNEPKALKPEVFAEGIKKFAMLAHSREELYGSPYCGLHYSDDLARLWNTNIWSEKLHDCDALNGLAPNEWEYTLQNRARTLIYTRDL